MSLLDRFNLSAALPPPPAAIVEAAKAAPVEAPAPAPVPVLPPPPPPPAPVQAPPPVVTAAPVEVVKFEPVPPPRTPEEMAVKRGPGRPPGAKNKRKVTIQDFATPEAAITAPEAPKLPAFTERLEVTVSRITIRHGLTINLGNYQSAKVEVELEASGRGADLLREEVSKRVRAALEEEAKAYLSAPAKT